MSASGATNLFTKLFLKAGFEWVTTPRGKDKLGWKGQQFPWVDVQFVPDPWGRKGMEPWFTVRLEMENRRGIDYVEREEMLFEERMTDLGDIPDIVERVVEAAEGAQAKRDAAQVGKIILDDRNVRRKVREILPQKGGYDQPAPVLLEGRNERFTYAELELPDADGGGRYPFLARNGVELVFCVEVEDNYAFPQEFLRDGEEVPENPAALAEGLAWFKKTFPKMKIVSIAELQEMRHC